MATHSSTLAWRIPWMEEPDGLKSMGLQRVRPLRPLRGLQENRVTTRDLLEKEMATHSSILAWRIPWMEEPDGLQSTGSQRVGKVETSPPYWAVPLPCPVPLCSQSLGPRVTPAALTQLCLLDHLWLE